MDGAGLRLDVAVEHRRGLGEHVADRCLVSLVVHAQTVGEQHATALAAAQVYLRRPHGHYRYRLSIVDCQAQGSGADPGSWQSACRLRES